jgi:2-aminoethylphosphonate-pyruvate transaminase
VLGEMLERDASIRWVAMVHHETTTGLLNPVQEVARLAHAMGRRILVDAISGLAGDPLPVLESRLDLVVGTANKCLQGLPGISFVLARREVLEAAKAMEPTSLYLHLPLLFAEQERGSHPFTTAVQVLFALHEALAELEEETVAGRIARLGSRAAMLRAGFTELGLSMLLPEPLRSSTLTTLRLPGGMPYDRLHDALKARGFVIYAGQGKTRAETFRVANMGALAEEELRELLAVMREVLGR